MNTENSLCTGHESPVGMSRRSFLGRFGMGLGAVALSDLLNPHGAAASSSTHNRLLPAPHFAAKAKRVIYLFQSGGPSQMDLFDYKPRLNDMNGAELVSAKT